jgi:hypothetical protein
MTRKLLEKGVGVAERALAGALEGSAPVLTLSAAVREANAFGRKSG